MSSFDSRSVTDAVPSCNSVLGALSSPFREQFTAGRYCTYFPVSPTGFDITAGFWARGYELNAHRLEASCGFQTLAVTAHSACQVAWYNGDDASTLSMLTGVARSDEEALIAFVGGEGFLPGYLHLLLSGGAERLRQIRSAYPDLFWANTLGRLTEWEQGTDFDTTLCVHRLNPPPRSFGLNRTVEAKRLMRIARAFVPDAGFELAYRLEAYDSGALEQFAAMGVELEYALAVLDSPSG